MEHVEGIDLAAYLKSDIEKWQALEKKGAFK